MCYIPVRSGTNIPVYFSTPVRSGSNMSPVGPGVDAGKSAETSGSLQGGTNAMLRCTAGCAPTSSRLSFFHHDASCSFVLYEYCKHNGSNLKMRSLGIATLNR